MIVQLTFENLNAKMKPHYALSLCFALSLLVGSLRADDCCKDGETKADDDDCTQFYECCTGEFVLKSCDDNYYWNASLHSCKLDVGQCNCQHSNCKEGELDENPSDCAGYLKCVNNEWVVEECAEGAYFDKARQICVIDSDGVCLNCVEGCTQEDLDDCTKYRVCTNGKYVTVSCPNGQYWNAKERQCQQDDGQCNGSNSTCKDEAKKINPEDCAAYFQCENNTWLNIECSEGSYYNATYEICQIDEYGVCLKCVEGDKIADQDNCAQYKECVNGKYVIKSCPVGQWWSGGKCISDDGSCNGGNSTCKDEAKKINPEDCAAYFQCENNTWLNIECSEGSYYNATYEICQIDEYGVCLKCVEGDKIADQDNCAQYKECVNGKYVIKSCPVGQWWSGGKCINDDGSCNGSNSTCTEGDKRVNPADCAGYLLCANNKWVAQSCPDKLYWNDTDCVYDTNNVCLNKTCDPECCDYPDNWMGPIDGNCSGFIQCVYGYKFEQTCPNNLHFNPNTEQCDYPNKTICDDGNPPPSGPSAGPSGTYCESHGACVGKSDGYMFAGVANDAANADNADNACTSNYIVCQCECEVGFVCPDELVFNNNIRSCDYRYNVETC